MIDHSKSQVKAKKITFFALPLVYRFALRACLHGGGRPQEGEVTCLGGENNNPPLHALLQPRHPGVHFLKIIEGSLST